MSAALKLLSGETLPKHVDGAKEQLFASDYLDRPKVEVSEITEGQSSLTQQPYDNSLFSSGVSHSYKRPNVFKVVPQVDANIPYWEKVLQFWEGRVVAVSVQDGQFTAVLTDKTTQANSEEIAVFGFEYVKKSDRPLIQVGSIFFWTLGRFRDVDSKSKKIGPSKNHQEIRFRRLPPLTPQKAKEIKELSKNIASLFHAN